MVGGVYCHTVCRMTRRPGKQLAPGRAISNALSMPTIYFSDTFDIPPDVLDEYGALDVSLVADLPVFVDPFLLFNSLNPEYQQLHANILRYMRFLKDVTLEGAVTPPLVDLWFSFPEVRQNWLGFSATGNRGHGLGRGFARSLHRNFHTVFRDFGEETVTRSSHIEKLGLIRDGVGRDTISDFTTNLILPFLCDYTQRLASAHLAPRHRRRVSVPKVCFHYETRSWMSATYDLPFVDDDYVLLTPKDILTRDEAWINRSDLISSFRQIAAALPDVALRAQINDYLYRVLPRDPKRTEKETHKILGRVVDRFPAVLDFYIREKEDHGDDAVSVSREHVRYVQAQFISKLGAFISEFLTTSDFYALRGDTYDEARRRILFLKDVIENKGGHKLFYLDGQPIRREADLQLLYRLTWYAPSADVSREANDGRGPADFKVSRGAGDKTLVEFKLAKNTALERNLAKQTGIYEKASDATHPSLKVIVYFSGAEAERVATILQRLGLEDSPHIIGIDARGDNKPSGSEA